LNSKTALAAARARIPPLDATSTIRRPKGPPGHRYGIVVPARDAATAYIVLLGVFVTVRFERGGWRSRRLLDPRPNASATEHPFSDCSAREKRAQDRASADPAT
jgi:hypothetical protein